jgi:hypothetical protein
MAGRVTQIAVEAVIASTSGSARVTQHAVEAVISPTSQAARVTQLAVEAVLSPIPNAIISQAGIEAARFGTPNALVSTAGLEIVRAPSTPVNALVSFAGIEVLHEISKGRIFLDSVVKVPGAGSFAASGLILGPRSGSFTAGAIRKASASGSLTVDAFLGGLNRGSLDAIRLQTMGRSIVALSYPGTSRTRGGQTVNKLSSTFTVGSEPVTIIVDALPDDGGSLGIVSDTSVVGSLIDPTVGEHDVRGLPAGQYYIFSYKDNIYRPGLGGAGSYTDFGTSYLTIPLQAWIKTSFTLDAEIKNVVTGTPFTVGAWVYSILTASFAVAASISGTRTGSTTVAAQIVRRPEASFTAGAWKAGLFTVGAFIPFSVYAQIVRRPFESFTVSAAITGFHADAVLKGPRSGSLTASSWLISRPTGEATLDAFVRPAFRVAAMVRVPRYRTLKVDARIGSPSSRVTQIAVEAVLLPDEAAARVTQLAIEAVISPVPNAVVSQAGIEAVRTGYEPPASVSQAGLEILKGPPYFLLDAYIVIHIFYINTVVFKPGDTMLPAPSGTLDSAIVWHWEFDYPANAWLAGRIDTDAVLFSHMGPVEWTASAIKRQRITGSFTVGAFKAISLRAVIKGQRKAIFTVFAYKRPTTASHQLYLDAEKRDPCAVWDPYTETWVYPHFTVDAFLLLHAAGSFPVEAAIIEEGRPQYSMFLDAYVFSNAMAGELLLEAELVLAVSTVVFEGEGSSHVVRNLVSERLSFPGTPNIGSSGNLSRDDRNLVSGPIRIIDLTPVTVTIWDFPSYPGSVPPIPLGFDSITQHLYEWIDEPGTYVFWPSYYYEDYYVWVSKNGPPYDPLYTGSGMVTYYRDDTVVDSRPAPTVDAWIVGTTGTPATIDAWIVGREKSGLFTVEADLAGVGEVRFSFAAEASILVPQRVFFGTAAVLAAKGFSVDALLFVRGFSADAWVQPYLRLDANIKKTITITPGPRIDAVLDYLRRSGSFLLGAEIVPEGERDGLLSLEAVVLGARPKRFYLAAQILSEMAFTVGAYIGHNFGVGAWVASSGGGLGGFPVGAYVRASSIIIFPEDGGDPTDPYGNPPVIGRSFRVKVEAFIPDPIPVGNDAEIERLIMLILEAEAELESLYCAVTHYTSQGAPATPSNPNPSGTGRVGSLPPAISQIGYWGAGDIDDCWVVATVWAAKAAGVPGWYVSVPHFRSHAGNPDRPGPTGGSLDNVIRGARGCWPDARIKRYASTDWNGFISLLKAGWIASLAVRSSGLPSSYRFGFNGLHQIGVAYQNGTYYIMNPLQHNGAALLAISPEYLRTAARGFSGGTICAAMFG